MKSLLENIKIHSIAAVLPKNKRSFYDYKQKITAIEMERIIKSTGINSVHAIKGKEDFNEILTNAAKYLIDALNIDCKTIDAIIVVTQTAQMRIPATSCILQDSLGISKDALAFDINYGCSGYIYGLYQASLLIHANQCQRVLLVTGDMITQYLNENDHHVGLILGDAFSATLLEKGLGNISFNIKTDGSGAKHLNLAATDNSYLHMNGAAIMEFALREVPSIVNDVLSLSNWVKTDVGFMGLHQANKFIVDYLAKKMQIPNNKAPIAIEKVGNTGPASIPLLLAQLSSNIKLEYDLTRSILCGFGAGLSWGACALDLSQTNILPVKEI